MRIFRRRKPREPKPKKRLSVSTHMAKFVLDVAQLPCAEKSGLIIVTVESIEGIADRIRKMRCGHCVSCRCRRLLRDYPGLIEEAHAACETVEGKDDLLEWIRI